MIDILIACGVTALVSSILFELRVKRVRRKTEHDAVVATVEVYSNGLKRFADSVKDICPNCAYNCNGALCDKVDFYNFIKFGTCTNYEKRRF